MGNLWKICNIVGPRNLRYCEFTKISNQGTDYKSVQYLHNIFCFWIKSVTHFLKVTQIMFLPICYYRFSIFALETLKLEWQCSQYLELNPTCVPGTFCQVVGCFIYILIKFKMFIYYPSLLSFLGVLFPWQL